MSRTKTDNIKLTDAGNSSSIQWLEGYYHELECNCCVWTTICLPIRIPRTLLDDLFTHGFCANKKIAELETKLNNITQIVPKQNDFSYVEILRNGKNEDQEQERKALNVVISGTKLDDHDENIVNNILKNINAVGVQPTSRKRVGKKNLDCDGLLIVSFGNKTDGQMVLKKAKNLKGISKYKKSTSIPTEQNPNKNLSKNSSPISLKSAEETDQNRPKQYYIRQKKIVRFVGKENPK